MFANLVAMIYINDYYESVGEVPQTERLDADKARHADSILETWSEVPGLNDNCSFNVEAFQSWYVTAKAELAIRNLTVHGRHKLSGVLDATPPELDATWPCGDFLPFLEKEMEDEKLLRSLATIRYNGKGIRVRVGRRTGDEERAFEQLYLERAAEIEPSFPNVARLLREVADCYKSTISFYERVRSRNPDWD